jgi:hypothetical protein
MFSRHVILISEALRIYLPAGAVRLITITILESFSLPKDYSSLQASKLLLNDEEIIWPQILNLGKTP